ncbi:MAG: AAA family ATPase [Arcanobacterium sp.]
MEASFQHANSQFRVDQAQNRRLAVLNPAAALEGDAPRLIDEWPLAPDLWNEVRHEIDARRMPGQFILSGSAIPADDATRHTGAGRISKIRMRPMVAQAVIS